MARILYGIHGTGHGHAMRGLILARAMPQHEFLFAASDDAPSVLEPEFRVARLPNLGTVFKNYRVDLGATIARAIPLLANRGRHIKDAVKLVEEFKPDICLTDLEYFIPLAAKHVGVPCMALDHQHIITCCEHHVDAGLRKDLWLQGLTPRWLFKPQKANLLISFYAPPLKKKFNALVAPPILRQTVLDLSPEDKGHIIVYQSNSTDRRLIDFLKTSTKRTAHVFGYIDEDSQYGHIHFHKRNEKKFLELLEGCSYVIQGGSHTLMSEALYLNKPILSLPLLGMVEQRLNAFYLEKNRYGKHALVSQLDSEFLNDFEKHMPAYRDAIAKGEFLGNNIVFKIIDRFAKDRVIPVFHQ